MEKKTDINKDTPFMTGNAELMATATVCDAMDAYPDRAIPAKTVFERMRALHTKRCASS